MVRGGKPRAASKMAIVTLRFLCEKRRRGRRIAGVLHARQWARRARYPAASSVSGLHEWGQVRGVPVSGRDDRAAPLAHTRRAVDVPSGW
jgi:hypothetical protein